MAFRVLMHGMSYIKAWKPKHCARECGISLSSVKSATRRLKKMGYVYTVPHPIKRNKFGYRFRLTPSLPDEEKPWYREMMRVNNGDLDGIVMGPVIDNGEWRKPGNSK
jgi:DNA-binding transcriptional MocR family regulator